MTTYKVTFINVQAEEVKDYTKYFTNEDDSEDYYEYLSNLRDEKDLPYLPHRS